VDLALHGEDAPVARQALAERQGVSSDYVAQLFRDLQDAELIEGVKGPGGGYRLARRPSEICAREIIEAVEGPIALVDCVEPEDETCCDRVDGCVAHVLWKTLSTIMREFLESVTLQDLSSEARRLSSASAASNRDGTGNPLYEARHLTSPLDSRDCYRTLNLERSPEPEDPTD
jgi:Rrf2 family iron-sulfur cluster assembly transcriptional regulator